MESKPENNTQEQTEIELDPYLLMEEILEKLKLLDYEALFTRVK